MLSLKNILITEYLPEALYEENYQLPEGKIVSRVYVEYKNVNVYRKADLPQVQEFLSEQMSILEMYFLEYRDIVDS